MALTDGGTAVIVSGIGPPLRITLAGTVLAGDPIGYSAGWVRADDDSIPASMIAGQSGFSGSKINAYQAAKIHSGRITDCAENDDVYLSATAGRYSATVATRGQKIGKAINATELIVAPKLAEQSGSIYMGSSLIYAAFDPANKYFYVLNTQAGGDSPKGMLLDVDVLTGTSGFRQGALQIQIDRASGQDFTATWDGNPDCGLKILANNRAANAVDRGAVRALDIQARNRGTNVVWVNGAQINARNDSGKTADTLRVLQLIAENYGTVETDIIGLDIAMLSENDTGSPNKVGILIRNIDQSAMAAVQDIIKISHTSTNGFTNLFNFAGASGEGIATGSLQNSDNVDIKCDARITLVWNGSTFYLPAYNTVQ